MAHPETGDCLVFNGEIYNFRSLRNELISQGVTFRSQSDTEVLLQALVRWGIKALDRLEGMFAFAFYNARQHELLLARDPLGIKPLYIAVTSDALVFGSEVRSLMASGLVPKEVSPAAIASCLAYGSVAAPQTIFKYVHSLPAGTFQRFNPDVLSAGIPAPTHYWQFPRLQNLDSIEDAGAAVRLSVRRAVRDHLVSDVPVGAFLSAGIDSTIVAAVAAECTPQLRTFTVALDEHPEFDEAPIARETARIIESQHTEIRLSEDDAKQAYLDWLDASDRPSVDGLNTFIISKAVRDQGIIVALSGLGGDELFAGYDCFTSVPRFAKWLKMISWLPPRLRSALIRPATFGRLPAVARKASDMARSTGSLLDLYLYKRRLLSDEFMRLLGVDAASLDLLPNFLPPDAVNKLDLDPLDPVWAISSWESQLYLPNTLLFDSDVNGMAHGLEIRVPMLDRRLVDYVCGLPADIRSPAHLPPKALLHHAFPDLLRSQVLNRRKTGFMLPIDKWLKGSIRDISEDSLQYLKSEGFLCPEGVDLVWQRYQSRQDQWTGPFMLCVLGHYLKKIQAIASPPRQQNYSPLRVPSFLVV